MGKKEQDVHSPYLFIFQGDISGEEAWLRKIIPAGGLAQQDDHTKHVLVLLGKKLKA